MKHNLSALHIELLCLYHMDHMHRSCRARLDLHNNRRRKRGESGSETYRSSARLERRVGEQLHQRISTRSRSRRSTRKARSDSSEVILPFHQMRIAASRQASPCLSVQRKCSSHSGMPRSEVFKTLCGM